MRREIRGRSFREARIKSLGTSWATISAMFNETEAAKTLALGKNIKIIIRREARGKLLYLDKLVTNAIEV